MCFHAQSERAEGRVPVLGAGGSSGIQGLVATARYTVVLTDEGSGITFCCGWLYFPGVVRFLYAPSDFPGLLSFLDSCLGDYCCAAQKVCGPSLKALTFSSFCCLLFCLFFFPLVGQYVGSNKYFTQGIQLDVAF